MSKRSAAKPHHGAPVDPPAASPVEGAGPLDAPAAPEGGASHPPHAAQAVARAIFGAGDDPASARRAGLRWLAGAASTGVLVPLIFYLRFGEVGPLGWGLTVFLVVFCLLAAVGLFVLHRPEYHTPVPLRGDWLDRLGAFWLLACAFGPFFGWVLTSLPALMVDNWRWFYAGRVLLSLGLPVLTALPLLRYVRGRGAWLMLALLAGVTALPVWSAWAVAQDLWTGPVGLVLVHSGVTLLTR